MDYINELERLRKKATTALITIIAVCIICCFMLLLLLANVGNGFGVGLSFFLTVGIFILLFVVYYKPLKDEFVKEYKDKIVKGCLEEIYDKVVLTHNEKLDSSLVESAYLVPIGNRYQGDDLITAEYKGIKFVSSDLHIHHVTSTGKTTQDVTYFKGKWIVIELKKPINGYLQIREKDFFGATKASKIFSNMPRTEKIKTESIRFNEIFEVRAEIQQTAFYILTPNFMEILLNLYDLEGQLMISFNGSALHIAVHNNENAFEPRMFEPVTERDNIRIKHEAKLIQQLIEELLINTNKKDLL